MGRLRPNPSNTNPEPAPSWDAEPTSPPPATAATDPLPPDSLATDLPQIHNADGDDDHEKTSTSPPPSPKPAVPPPPLTSHVDPGPVTLPLHPLDDIEPAQAVVFPPASSVAAATFPDYQNVPCAPGNNSNKQETGRNGPGFGPGPSTAWPCGATTAHINSHWAATGPAVTFPPQKADHQATQPSGNNALVPVHNDSIVPPPPLVAPLAPAAGSSGLQPEGPSVILVPYVGVPWKSGIFDCLQHPTNGSFLYFFLFLVICHWNIGIRYRTKLRNAFQIAETPLTDRLAHTRCSLCSLCQEFRELNYRGLDPFKGYQGVIAGILHEQRQQRGEIIPPTSQAMAR